jgi:DNA-binding protein HU-beta
MAVKPTTKAKKPAAPAKKAAAAKKTARKKVEIITLKSIFEHLAESQELTKKQGHAMLEKAVGLLTDHLISGNKIRLSGIGILEVKDRPARMGRNPATGEAIKIAASKKIAFRAAKGLKAAI